jgi:glycosyltransferase involved in cell wall biosynthesis
LPTRIAPAASRRSTAAALRAVDRRGAAGVHHFVSISHHVADRVRRSYGRESTVVYPPVRPRSLPDVYRGRQPDEPFLLSLGRLVPYKRVDLAVEAAESLGMRLVVAGDGPERKRIERLAGRHTEVRGAVSDEEAARLLSECAAFVFCAEEDFGIAPLEANAFGKPVVAYRRGAASETLVDGRTAVFFERQSVQDVAAAITRCLRTSWEPLVMEENARRFEPARFRDEMRVELERAWSARCA